MTTLRATEHGFRFGPAEVQAVTSVERKAGAGEHVVIGIRTDAGKGLNIYISPTGRSVRVFLGSKELQ